MLESYEHEISFIDLEGRRICEHIQLLTIGLELMIKRSLSVPISNRCTSLSNIINFEKNLRVWEIVSHRHHEVP